MFGQFVALIEQADDANPNAALRDRDGAPEGHDGSSPPPSDDERNENRPDAGDHETSGVSRQMSFAAADATGELATIDPVVATDARSSPSENGESPTADDRPPSPVVGDGATTGGAAIARLSLRLASAEVSSRRAETRARAAERAAEELTQLLSAKDEALRRLVVCTSAASDAGDAGRPPSAGADAAEGDEARYEALAALEGNSDAAAEAIQFRQVVASQSAALDEAYDELKKQRAQIVAIEAAVAEVEISLHASNRERDAAVADARQSRAELSSSRKEVGRLSAKLGAMGATVDDLTAKNKAARGEVETALAQILRRDNELSLLRQAGGGGSSSNSGGGGGPARTLRQDPLMQMVSTKGKWGSRAVGLADMLDVLMIRFGRLLRSNAMLRLIVMLYIVVLHVYVFNAAMVFLHHSGKMPDHMGDNVHDHLDHHLVH